MKLIVIANLKKPFNLLKPIRPPKDLWDKIYEWIVSRAAVVLMFVIIFMGFIFIAKVIVDTDAKNKTKSIERGLTQLTFYSNDIEPQARNLIRKVDSYVKLIELNYKYSTVLREIYDILASSSFEHRLRYDGERILVSGVESLDQLRELESKLRNSKNYKNLSFGALSVNDNQLSLMQQVQLDRSEFVLNIEVDQEVLINNRI